MKIGNLNKLITLQYKTRVSDGMGGFTETYNDSDEVFAAIWPKSAKDAVNADQTIMTATHRIRIRYRSTMRGSWRIKFGNRYFAVTGIVNPEERNEWMDLICKEAT